jgi:exonuclease SbcC
MQILLKKMSLVNFKGIRSAEFDFNPTVNTVLGDNATGKTTIMNAFLWCLFGKDIEDRKDFEIKTYDKEGKIIERLEHSVELVLDVDSKEITLKRVLSEKWQKKRCADDLEFTGNETTYFWNEVPLKQMDYQSKIKDLIDEGLFKLLTNVNYFHSLHWEKRREIIFSLAGEITDSEILAESNLTTDHANIIGNILSHGKTMAEAKAETANKKKRIKDEIQFIPSRIDEAERSKPNTVDTADITRQINDLKKQIGSKKVEVEKTIKAETDYSEKINQDNEDYNNRLELYYNKKNEVLQLEREIESNVRSGYKDTNIEISGIMREIDFLDNSLINVSDRITIGTKKIDVLDNEISEKRAQWKKINSETLPEFESCTCPTCKQSLPEDDVRIKKDEFLHNFNESKKRRLEDNEKEGKEMVLRKNDMNTLLQALNRDFNELSDKKTTLQQKADELKKQSSSEQDINTIVSLAISENVELSKIKNELLKLQESIADKPHKDDKASELFAKRQTIQNEIEVLNNKINVLSAQLGNDEQIKIIDKRIAELKEQESTLAAELNRLEGIEYAILQFEKQRVAFIENKINDKFEYVTFRLFETQINGQEIPVCKTLINGIPYESANTASRINAGLAIINALSDYNSVYAPIFVDNAESTNVFITTKSQVVKLVVTKDKELIFLNLK